MPKIALEIENDRDATFLWELLNSPEADRGHRTPVAAWTTLVYDDSQRPDKPGARWRFSFTLDVDAEVPQDRADKIAMDAAQELVRRMARHTSRLRGVSIQGRPVAFEEEEVAGALESALVAAFAAGGFRATEFAAGGSGTNGSGTNGSGTGHAAAPVVRTSPGDGERRHELSLRAAMDQLLAEGLINFTVAGEQRMVSRAPRPMSPVDLTMVDLVLQQYRTVRATK